MSDPQLTEIEATVVSVVRKAYDLGRSDALKKVFAAVNADRGSVEPLALMAPEPEPKAKPVAPPEDVEPPKVINGSARPADTPWWAFPVR